MAFPPAPRPQRARYSPSHRHNFFDRCLHVTPSRRCARKPELQFQIQTTNNNKRWNISCQAEPNRTEPNQDATLKPPPPSTTKSVQTNHPLEALIADSQLHLTSTSRPHSNSRSRERSHLQPHLQQHMVEKTR